LGHWTPYYPQGNDLAEEANKNLIKIINKMLGTKKRTWDTQLKYALWVDKIITKWYVGTYSFQLVYGIYFVLLVHLGTTVMKILQHIQEEIKDMQCRINQTI
jgi:Fe2+ transport system protein B